MINLKDYDIRNGVAYPKKQKVEAKKPEVKAKVITKDDLKPTDKEVENEKAR